MVVETVECGRVMLWALELMYWTLYTLLQVGG